MRTTNWAFAAPAVRNSAHAAAMSSFFIVLSSFLATSYVGMNNERG
jgi:hypothetical protein